MAYNEPSGNENVIKAGDITPEGLERGYRAYATMRDEEALKTLVKAQWEERYSAETAKAEEMRKSQDYSSQIAALSAEIESLRSTGADIQKSAEPATSDIRVPSHEEFAAMGNDLEGWRAVEELARRAVRGE